VTIDIDAELKRLEGLPSVADQRVAMLAAHVETFGWQQTLTDLAVVAEKRCRAGHDEGRTLGVLQGAAQFISGGQQ
jgi:hypothetical protein